MLWLDKNYHSLNYELRKEFGQKIFKLSLDGSFTCPNRDGTLSDQGCIFCSESGSGDFSAPRTLPIALQIEQQIQLLKPKWPQGKYIAYFQNFTNTYAPVDELREKYEQALAHPDVVGLAIATRPDCIDQEILELLSELNKKTYLWIELGLQTIHEKTSKLINRGYELSVFDTTIDAFKKNAIRVVVHMIVNLPHETYEDMIASIKYIAAKEIFGVKLHMLHILKNTALAQFYADTPFDLLSKESYINFIVDALELLPPDTTIHRMTGDGPKELLIAPSWIKDKRSVLNGIEKEIRKRKSHQSLKFKP